jgi:TfoX/Sxy family transcriptional regulator of competence genes
VEKFAQQAQIVNSYSVAGRLRMVYNERLTDRIIDILAGHDGMTQTKMFGGVGFLIHGNMACGVNKDDLIVRVGPEQYEAALKEPHAKVFDMTGRPMKGWIVVTAGGYHSNQALKRWIARAVDYAGSLPPKSKLK